jgi:hypothetical protein
VNKQRKRKKKKKGGVKETKHKGTHGSTKLTLTPNEFARLSGVRNTYGSGNWVYASARISRT